MLDYKEFAAVFFGNEKPSTASSTRSYQGSAKV
jgi:hypothetical protein